MFQDLDATISALLAAELGIRDVAISFAGPDKEFPPSSVRLPAVSFFLYDVRENLELRSTDTERERAQDGTMTRHRPPARVDCSYLITAWPSDATHDPAADEHKLLGEVLKVLLRFRKIPTQYLKGELVTQSPPVPARVLAGSGQLQSLGEFWQAMGGRPKAMLHYGVTLSLDVFGPEPAGPKITQKTLRLSHVNAG